MCSWCKTWSTRRPKWMKVKLLETELQIICSCRTSSDLQLSEQRALHHSAHKRWQRARLTAATRRRRRLSLITDARRASWELKLVWSYRQWKISVLWGGGVTDFYRRHWQTADPERRAGRLRWWWGWRTGALINVTSIIWREQEDGEFAVSQVYRVYSDKETQVSDIEINYWHLNQQRLLFYFIFL